MNTLAMTAIILNLGFISTLSIAADCPSAAVRQAAAKSAASIGAKVHEKYLLEPIRLGAQSCLQEIDNAFNGFSLDGIADLTDPSKIAAALSKKACDLGIQAVEDQVGGLNEGQDLPFGLGGIDINVNRSGAVGSITINPTIPKIGSINSLPGASSHRQTQSTTLNF